MASAALSLSVGHGSLTPRVVYVTYHNRSAIPSTVIRRLAAFTQGYRVVFYDDKASLSFLSHQYGRRVAEKYDALEGAHKADLWRYCMLYSNGGVYVCRPRRRPARRPLDEESPPRPYIRPWQLDIDVVPKTRLEEAFPDRMRAYTVISSMPRSIFQAIISVPPRNPVLKELIRQVLATPTEHLRDTPLLFTQQAFETLTASSGEPKVGDGESQWTSWITG